MTPISEIEDKVKTTTKKKNTRTANSAFGPVIWQDR
jgi:hypothetical protein